MTKDTGGTAFPLPLGSETVEGQEGITMRDYFAESALGLCFAQYLNHAEVDGFTEGWRDDVASDAYLMADAMLRARGQ